MLRFRLLSAAIIISVVVALLYVDFYYAPAGAYGSFVAPLYLLVILLSAGECLNLVRQGGLNPQGWAVYLGAGGVGVAACIPLFWPISGESYPDPCSIGKPGWPLAACGFALLGIFSAEMSRFKDPEPGTEGTATRNLGASFLIVGYAGLLPAFLVFLRTFHSNEWGMVALVGTIFVTKMSDTGAYFAGRSLGRHKMAPVLSPKKTWEGAVGAYVVGGLASIVLFAWIAPWITQQSNTMPPIWACILYGAILTSAGIIGDLAESLLKRDLGAKDSSSWLPGLGGILDTVDSVLATALPSFLCWAAGLVGPGAL